MVFVAAGLLFVFAAQVVSVHALLFNFTDVQQCAPVLISFTGKNISVTPDRLWLLPVNSTATFIPLGDPSVYTTGISLPFVPYAADTTFLTSIDDSNGIHVLLTSNVTTVLPSPTGNSSCVSVSNDAVPRHFTLTSAVNQCEPITVKYDTTVVKQAPSVRLYNPNGSTLRLNQLSDDPTTGTGTYMLNFNTGKTILLVMDEGNGILETTPLITVGGNAFNKGCFSANNSNNASSTSVEGPNNTSDLDPDDTDGDTASLSKAVIIGSATGGSAVVFIALSMAIFVIQERKKRLLKETLGFESLIEQGANPNGFEKPGSPGPGVGPALRSVRSAATIGSGNVGIAVRPPTADAIPNPFARDRDDDTVMNPPYTSNSLFSTLKSARVRGSMASWAQAIPEDQRYPAGASASRVVSPRPGSGLAADPARNNAAIGGAGAVGSPLPTGSRLSLESLDIEGMLNMATLQSEGQYRSRKNSDATILSRAMPSPSPVVVLNANTNGSRQGSEIYNPYQTQYLNQTPNENQTWQGSQGSPGGRANSPAAAIATSSSPTTAALSPTRNAPTTASVAPATTPPPAAFLRPLPTRNRNRRSPLDLPVDPTEPESMAFSGYSVDVTTPLEAVVAVVVDDENPFNASPAPIPRARDPASPQSSGSARFLGDPLRTGDSFRIAQATSGGLPVSPSLPDGMAAAREPRRSSADWYGIAR